MASMPKAYLAGPNRGVGEGSRLHWRLRAVKLLREHYECTWLKDFAKSASTLVVPRERPLIAASTVVLAYMTAPSIGTTLGIVRARAMGKPVVLVQTKKYRNEMLEAIIYPEEPHNRLDNACERLIAMHATPSLPCVVASTGEFEAFDAERLARSIQALVPRGHSGDFAVNARLLGGVEELIRGRRGPVSPRDITHALEHAFEQMLRTPQVVDSAGDLLKAMYRQLKPRVTPATSAHTPTAARTAKETANEFNAAPFSGDRRNDIAALLEKLGSTGKLAPEGCLGLVQALYPERVEILHSALESARHSGEFLMHRHLLSMLLRFAGPLWESLRSGRPEKEAAHGVFSADEWAPSESETTLKNPRLSAARTFDVRGRPVQMFAHLKLGHRERSGSTRGLRIHYAWLAHDRKLIVGHCGRHLDLLK